MKASHLQLAAYVYIQQSTPGQIEQNRESTAWQYAFSKYACQPGWPEQQVVVVDEDRGLSGPTTHKRLGFARVACDVAPAHVGIVLGLDVSRLQKEMQMVPLAGVERHDERS